MAEWLMAIDCKSISNTYIGSNPISFKIFFGNYSSIGRVSNCDFECYGFEPLFLPFLLVSSVGEIGIRDRLKICSHMRCWFKSNTEQETLFYIIKNFNVIDKEKILFSLKVLTALYYCRNRTRGLGYFIQGAE